MAVIELQNLKTYYSTLRGYVKAVDGVSLPVEKAEALGLAGESGCGKTTVALSIMRILPQGGRIVDGKILFKGKDIVKLGENEMRKKIRWKGISIIFQGAMNALNPVYSIENQIVEAIRAHEEDVTEDEAKKRVELLLETVGIESTRSTNYPYEYSGGMRQRAMIAMALACNPDLVIADEPGTALDVIVQAQVLQLMKELKDKLGLAMIVITHDLSIIAEICEKAAIMYAGKLVEYGDIVSVFNEPLHPYTRGLIGAFPNIRAAKTGISSIPGFPPDLLKPPSGCRFHPRCQYAMDICKKQEPEVMDVGKKHFAACHLLAKA